MIIASSTSQSAIYPPLEIITSSLGLMIALVDLKTHQVLPVLP